MSTSSENLIYNSKHYVRQGFVREKEIIPDSSIKLIQTVYTDVETVRGKKENKEGTKMGRKEEGGRRSNQDGSSDHFRGWGNSDNTELQEHRGEHLVAAYTLRKVHKAGSKKLDSGSNRCY